MPDGDAALDALIAFLARFRKILNPLFDGIRKARDMEKCLYEGRTFLWTFLVGFLFRHGSRNAMDADRNDPNYADAILKLADQRLWPEGEPKTAPCTPSCCRWLGNRANRYVLEAKLVTPWGSAYSTMSVPIKPWHDRDEDEKQDGEYHGFLRLAWARGVEIAKGTDDWHVFNVVRVSEDEANGAPYEGRFATSMDVASLKDAGDICKWGRRRWDIESSFHVEKNGGYGLEHNFCNKARVSRNIYLLMQIAHNLWQLFNSTCLLPLQKKRKNRNMTQRKWAQVILQKMIARGVALVLDEPPRRYVSREFLTL